jgi:transposase
MGPYTSDIRKAQYLTYRECGKSGREAAKLCNLTKSTAADI